MSFTGGEELLRATQQSETASRYCSLAEVTTVTEGTAVLGSMFIFYDQVFYFHSLLGEFPTTDFTCNLIMSAIFFIRIQHQLPLINFNQDSEFKHR